jgi:hypothetical protein
MSDRALTSKGLPAAPIFVEGFGQPPVDEIR